MSGTKYASVDKVRLQDPEAIITIGGAIEEEGPVSNPSSIGADSSLILGATYKKEAGDTNPSRLELPKLTINGKQSEDRTIRERTFEPNLLQSKPHAFSEPDLKHAYLYNKPQGWEPPVHQKYEERAQRKKTQNAGKLTNLITLQHSPLLNYFL